MTFNESEASADPTDRPATILPRYARLSSYDETDIGVCIFLSVSDLRKLNIDPDTQSEIEYYIRERGSDQVVEISGADSTDVDTSANSITD